MIKLQLHLQGKDMAPVKAKAFSKQDTASDHPLEEQVTASS